MTEGGRLGTGTAFFLLVVAIFADSGKFLLDVFFGVGVILDPFFITPITTAIFWITLNHNGIPMFSGKNWISGWTNELVSLIPGIDALPDWTAYAIYLAIKYR